LSVDANSWFAPVFFACAWRDGGHTMSIGVLEVTQETAPMLGAGIPSGSPLAGLLNKIISSLADGARVFLIEWEGRDVPRGAPVAR
jgi:hypothetical protein